MRGMARLGSAGRRKVRQGHDPKSTAQLPKSWLIAMLCFTWNGSEMVPMRPKAADARFVIGQRYWLDEVSDRSWLSHQQQFAWIAEAWGNLPHSMAEMFPSPEHLRKAALIATGWFRETIVDCGNRAAAARVAAYARGEDEFARVVVRGSTVAVQKARSQRMHGLDRMDKAEFQKAKEDILAWIAELLDVEPQRLLQHQGAA